MRVRLLNDGGYGELSHIDFPVEVSADQRGVWGRLVGVPAEELIRIGAIGWDISHGDLSFFIGSECEVLPE